MDKFRTRPKGDYITNADWMTLYALTEHWKSDLLFYKDDLKFLHHLIDRYFIWITKRDDMEKVHNIAEVILLDQRACDGLLKRINTNIADMAVMIDDPLKNGGQIFRIEHSGLEDDIVEFIGTLRKNRKKLFAITEFLMDSEKLEYLLKE